MSIKRTSFKLLLVLIGSVASSLSIACRDLAEFYDVIDADPGAVIQGLSTTLEDCYNNSEYFAILGSAYLRQGDLLRALESLERALLLDPQNGAAAVDFAEVLYRQGQSLNAIEINSQLLSREDLPQGLREAIGLRQRLWQRSVKQKSFSLGASSGYDNNLNSAPIADQLALTLSGNPVVLDVSSEFLAAGASYARLTASGGLSTQGQSINSHLTGNFTGRFSENSDYELLQASARYRFSEANDEPRWNATFGADHLNWGGHAVFSSTTLRAAHLLGGYGSCRAHSRFALQYQLYHAQELLSGYEYSLGASGECGLMLGGVMNRIGIETSALRNDAKYSERLGADRRGWQANFFWQRPIGAGQIFAQYQHTKFRDEDGYSSLFKNGAKRNESLHSVYFRYTLPLKSLGTSAQFVGTMAYHNQNSSITLFRTRGTSAEIGVFWGF
ncbi:MAG: tetratricopeptide repeat protein [Gammaproteobacteria bacterium]|nr:tetratricopeptide repeat protein [Gammaproteobacteria bacterium]